MPKPENNKMEKPIPKFQKRFAELLIWYLKSTEPWISLVGALIGILASVLSTFLIERPEEPSTGKYYSVLIAASAILILLTFFVSIIRRGPTKIAKLKSELLRTFLGSLDSSNLNPKRKGIENA
jgi:hypothetical protein